MALNIPWHHGSEVVTRMVTANIQGWMAAGLIAWRNRKPGKHR